jgi:uncharacterized damage-inducible protein DinB
MISPHYAQTLAQYNRWMNAKLYSVCERLSDEERKADRGAFFKSIHSTLNHVLWTDILWMDRFTQGTRLAKEHPKVAGGVDLYADWAALKAARAAMDAEIDAWAATLTDAWLAADFTWNSQLTKTARSKPAWLLVTHFFNHQTHHRGQVTTLLSQRGIDPGVTDLMLSLD